MISVFSCTKRELKNFRKPQIHRNSENNRSDYICIYCIIIHRFNHAKILSTKKHILSFFAPPYIAFFFLSYTLKYKCIYFKENEVTMKKILVLLSAGFLLSSGFSQAAVPQGGYFLDKNGVPLTEEMQTKPSLKSNPMLPQSGAVHTAMESLEHSSATVIRMTVTEDGTPADAVVVQSAGSVVLDEYAIRCVEGWRFNPAKLEDKPVRAAVSIPVRFLSMMVSKPATPADRSMKKPSDEVKEAIERNNHPVIHVSVYITADGKTDGRPKADNSGNLPGSDFKILSGYAENSVAAWIFTPAMNPDGEPIPQELIVPVQL